MARSAISAASVSTKHCVEIANALRGKKVDRAKTILDDAINLKKAIPYLRFKKGVGHKKGIGPGRYPVKASTEVLVALNTCEANALSKGLNTDGLKIIHISAHMASRPWHYGRARRRKMKRTNIEIVLEESVKSKTESKVQKKDEAVKKAEKSETKKETKTKPDVQATKPQKKKETKPVEKKAVAKAEKTKVETTKPAGLVEKKTQPKVEKKPVVKKDNKQETPKDQKPVEKTQSNEMVTKDEPKKDTVTKD